MPYKNYEDTLKQVRRWKEANKESFMESQRKYYETHREVKTMKVLKARKYRIECQRLRNILLNI